MYLPAQAGYQKIITEAMEYSLMAGGKTDPPDADGRVLLNSSAGKNG